MVSTREWTLSASIDALPVARPAASFAAAIARFAAPAVRMALKLPCCTRGERLRQRRASKASRAARAGVGPREHREDVAACSQSKPDVRTSGFFLYVRCD